MTNPLRALIAGLPKFQAVYSSGIDAAKTPPTETQSVTIWPAPGGGFVRVADLEAALAAEPPDLLANLRAAKYLNPECAESGCQWLRVTAVDDGCICDGGPQGEGLVSVPHEPHCPLAGR